ncbi:hypothetical protein ACP4OV_001146 [Aristida adscensionis]
MARPGRRRKGMAGVERRRPRGGAWPPRRLNRRRHRSAKAETAEYVLLAQWLCRFGTRPSPRSRAEPTAAASCSPPGTLAAAALGEGGAPAGQFAGGHGPRQVELAEHVGHIAGTDGPAAAYFSVDPNSKHLGTTVWDASMVFVKFLEKNSRKGRFCPSKMKGKRVIELGAGCGLAGFGMALLGCDVVTTDQVEVLPLLMRNVERNKSWISQSNSDSGSLGSITVAELDWGNKEHIRAVEPPFDYIIGTDVHDIRCHLRYPPPKSICRLIIFVATLTPSAPEYMTFRVVGFVCCLQSVYSEHLLQPLLETIIALSGPKTKIMLGYEVRSTTVHDQMMDMWKSNFIVKTISKSKMDVKYQHPSIHLYMMDPKAPLITDAGADDNVNDEEEDVSNQGEDEDPGVESGSCSGSLEAKSGNLDDWEIRRCGAMAARLLKDVKL